MSGIQVNGTLVLETFSALSPFTLEVQQFAVWDKDAKDDSGFVGYCYLDLFPRGKDTASLICVCLR
jgi:hypothetical protein